MEKKRYKMYKKGKKWLVAPIVFLGILGASAFATDQVHADEASQDQIVQVSDQAPPVIENVESSNVTSPTTENENNSAVDQPVTEETTGSESTMNEDQEELSNDQVEATDSDKDDSSAASEEETDKTNEVVESESNKPDTSESTETPTTPSTENKVKDETPKQDIQKEEQAKKDPMTSKAANTSAKSTTPASTKAATVVKISIFRVYNPNSGEHLHTMNSNEKDSLVRLGWRYEGVSMVVTNTGKQLFRIYNPNSGEHHFTLNMNEINMLKRAGWRYEGIAWLTPNSGVAMYRVFNPNSRGAGSHHYTMNVNERNSLLKAGWRNEGVSWYTLGTKSRQEIMLDWFYARQGKVTYSMENRNGSKSYDCSSAVFYALIEAGYLKSGTWIGNTDTLFSYEGRLFKAISSKDVRRGDIFVAGKKGSSGGSFGHTGVATSNSKIIHCNYRDNGISETVITGRTGDPCYWFRFI